MTQLIIAIIVVAVILAITIVLAIRGKKEIIYKMLYALVNEAENLFGSKTGKQKFAYVMEKIYSLLPTYIKVFITYQTLEKWIEQALVEAKEYWAELAGITDDKTVKISGFIDN